MDKRIVKPPLPLDDKLNIIKRIQRGEKMGDLAEEFGIGRTTIHDIYKNRAKIQEFAKGKLYRICKRQNLRRGKNPRVEEALYEWYLQEKKTGMPISSTVMITRAKEIHKEISNKDDFPTSTGWLTGFKRRYKIKFTRNDDLPSDNESDKTLPTEIDVFKDKFFQKIVELELCPSQVYIVTDNELCWRILPADTMGNKLNKDKITFLSCANASGLHKLKLLVVGNTHRSHELGNVNLPIHFFGQKITRITEESFKTWFDECFVVETRNWLTDHNLPPKALLLADQSLCHSSETDFTTADESVTILFYPPELKNFLPLDQKVMEIVNKNYKRHLLITASSRDQPIDVCLKQFNMKDMVFTLAENWQSLSASTISFTWKGIWDSMVLDISHYYEEVSDEQYDQALVRSIAGDLLLSVDVLQKWFNGKDDHADNSEMLLSSPVEDNVITPVSLKEAVSSFDKCIQWAEQNASSCEGIALLRKMRDKALMSKHAVLEGEFVDESTIFGN